MNQVRLQKLTDYTSISLAGACVVHCFIAPGALILFPVVGATTVFEQIFHELLLLLIIPLSSVAIFLGCRRHKDFGVVAIGVAGLCFLLAGAFATEAHEEPLTITGSLVMILGHLRNFSLCRKAGCCHEPQGKETEKFLEFP